jgi:hypothetical protein
MAMFFSSLDDKYKRVIRLVSITFISLLIISFLKISSERFESNKGYEIQIPEKAITYDPIIYSYLDYVSQWYPNSIELLDNYKGDTFTGQIAAQPILSLLGNYHIIDYSDRDYLNLRKNLWPKHWASFNGLVAYSVYDFGFILTIVLCFIYYWTIRKLKPDNYTISLNKLFIVALVIQIPLLAIFYSQIDGLIIPFLFLFGMRKYLNRKINLK